MSPRLGVFGFGLGLLAGSGAFCRAHAQADHRPEAYTQRAPGPCTAERARRFVDDKRVPPLAMTMESEICYQRVEGYFDRPTDSLRDLLYGRPLVRTYYSDTMATRMISTRMATAIKASVLDLTPGDDIVETATYIIEDDLAAPPVPVGTDNGATLIYPMVYDTPAPPPIATPAFDLAGAALPPDGGGAAFGPAFPTTPEWAP